MCTLLAARCEAAWSPVLQEHGETPRWELLAANDSPSRAKDTTQDEPSMSGNSQAPSKNNEDSEVEEGEDDDDFEIELDD